MVSLGLILSELPASVQIDVDDVLSACRVVLYVMIPRYLRRLRPRGFQSIADRPGADSLSTPSVMSFCSSFSLSARS
jgi:hypothetical protein